MILWFLLDILLQLQIVTEQLVISSTIFSILVETKNVLCDSIKPCLVFFPPFKMNFTWRRIHLAEPDQFFDEQYLRTDALLLQMNLTTACNLPVKYDVCVCWHWAFYFVGSGYYDWDQLVDCSVGMLVLLVSFMLASSNLACYLWLMLA